MGGNACVRIRDGSRSRGVPHIAVGVTGPIWRNAYSPNAEYAGNVARAELSNLES